MSGSIVSLYTVKKNVLHKLQELEICFSSKSAECLIHDDQLYP